jgi:LmbE family N-acetylglucosaminyl deacetylase
MKRYVFFEPHPDDLELNCSQLLHYLAVVSAQKHDIRIASVTKGEFGLPGFKYDRFKGDFLAGVRTKELYAAAAIHRISPNHIDFFGYVDGLVPFDKEFVGRIAEYLNEHRPDVIVAPEGLFTWYYHNDHLNTGRAVFYVIHHKMIDFTPSLYFYNTIAPNVFFPFPAEGFRMTDELIECHKTQVWLLKNMKHLVRPLALLSGFKVKGTRYAEAYRRVYFGDDSRLKNKAGPLATTFTHFYSGLPFFQAKYPEALLQQMRKVSHGS